MSQPKPRIPPKIPYVESRDTVIRWKKGKKKPNPACFVDSAWNLVQRHHRGSSEKAADDIKVVGARTLERLASIAKLPESIIQSLRKGEIGIDVASSITGLKNSKLQIRIAKYVAHMNAHEARQVVRSAKRCPDASFELLESKGKTEKIYQVPLLLNKAEFTKLKREASKMQMKWDGLCVKIIRKWLGKR